MIYLIEPKKGVDITQHVVDKVIIEHKFDIFPEYTIESYVIPNGATIKRIHGTNYESFIKREDIEPNPLFTYTVQFKNFVESDNGLYYLVTLKDITFAYTKQPSIDIALPGNIAVLNRLNKPFICTPMPLSTLNEICMYKLLEKRNIHDKLFKEQQ